MVKDIYDTLLAASGRDIYQVGEDDTTIRRTTTAEYDVPESLVRRLHDLHRYARAFTSMGFTKHRDGNYYNTSVESDKEHFQTSMDFLPYVMNTSLGPCDSNFDMILVRPELPFTMKTLPEGLVNCYFLFYAPSGSADIAAVRIHSNPVESKKWFMDYGKVNIVPTRYPGGDDPKTATASALLVYNQPPDRMVDSGSDRFPTGPSGPGGNSPATAAYLIRELSAENPERKLKK